MSSLPHRGRGALAPLPVRAGQGASPSRAATVRAYPLHGGPAFRRPRRTASHALMALAALLLLLGVGLMSYPAVASWLSAASGEGIVEAYDAEASSVGDARREQMLADARAYNDRLRSQSVVMTDPFDAASQKVTDEQYEAALDVGAVEGGESGAMGAIRIPEIGQVLPIYHGATESSLARGVGHLQNSSLPVGGPSTHAVLSAHAGLPSARLFTDLDELREGDVFEVDVLGERLGYQVYAIEVVTPDQVSSLRIVDGEDLVTLVTCTPIGVNTHRLLVHARRCELPPDGAEAPSRVGITPEQVAAGVSAALGGGTFAFLAVRARRLRKGARRG